MKKLRRASERGFFDFGWLKTFHTFSFGDYIDPLHRRFKNLRVINEDWVAPGQGFQTHPHADMEIITYVLEGALEHRDSMGNGSVIPAGEVQYMSAGTGVTHSEFNPSPTNPVHLLQIWIFPDKKNYAPQYNQAKIKQDALENGWISIAGPSESLMSIRQSTFLLATRLNQKGTKRPLVYPKENPTGVWIHVVKGKIDILAGGPEGNEEKIGLNEGDGLGFEFDGRNNESTELTICHAGLDASYGEALVFVFYEKS